MKNERILAIDILRGITIAGMILVNNPGSWSHIYAPLRHAEWNGLTPTDLVFPFFMFIMGMSAYLSLQKSGFRWSGALLRKVVRRTLLIFLIGLAIGWFSRFCRYWVSPTEGVGFLQQLWESVWTFDRQRIPGVMQRLAVCYGLTTVVALSLNHRQIPRLIVSLLVGYTLLLLCGNGFVYGEENILSVVDRALFTPAHLYQDRGIDPEGLLSTLPALAHVLLGFWVGSRLFGPGSGEEGESRVLRSMRMLLYLGAVWLMVGGLLQYGCPINKKVWSPTFVLMTCGLACLLLGILVNVIDVQGRRRWCRFFEVFGVNPLFLYVQSGVLSILLGTIRVPVATGRVSLHTLVYRDWLCPWMDETTASLCFALLFLLLNWVIGWQLYRRRIYIKL